MKSLHLTLSILFFPLSFLMGQIPDYYRLSAERFFALPETQQIIDVRNPNNLLLDAAIFQATNQVRLQHNLPVFEWHEALQKAAQLQSESMIEQNFYGHGNPKPEWSDFVKRVKLFPQSFVALAENVAQYPTIDCPEWYGIRQKANKEYEYYDARSNKVYVPHTYASYAQAVVKGWYNSPPHRQNILNSAFKYMGCAARLQRNPYKQKETPYARMTQDFGG
jgi:uncharacterized protein YkwD